MRTYRPVPTRSPRPARSRGRGLRIASAGLTLGVLLAACGGGSSEQASPVQEAVAAATELAQEPAAGATGQQSTQQGATQSATAEHNAKEQSAEKAKGKAKEKAAKARAAEKADRAKQQPAKESGQAKSKDRAKTPTSNEPANSGRSTEAKKPAPAPAPAPRGVLLDLEVRDVNTGATVNLRDLAVAGKPTLLWFWAPHCPLCMAEAPDVVDFEAKYGDQVQIVGVGAQDDFELAQDFVERTDTQELTMIWDETGKSWLHYEVTNQPTVIVLDREGNVEQRWFRNFDEVAIREACQIEE